MNRERIAELEEKYLKDHPPGESEPLVFETDSGEFDIEGRDAEGCVDVNSLRRIPLITSTLISDDWDSEPVETWFVDSSGFGGFGGPALIISEFIDALKKYVRENPTHGFGIIGVGQFQVHVGAFRPTE